MVNIKYMFVLYTKYTRKGLYAMGREENNIQKNENPYKYKKYAERLKEVISESPYTHEEIKQKLNKSSLQRLINGKQKISVDDAKTLANELGIRYEYLINLDDTYKTEYEKLRETNAEKLAKAADDHMERAARILKVCELYTLPNFMDSYDFWFHFFDYLDSSIQDSINNYMQIFHRSMVNSQTKLYKFDDIAKMDYVDYMDNMVKMIRKSLPLIKNEKEE